MPERPENNFGERNREVFQEGDMVIFDTSERNQIRVDETTRSAVHELVSKYGPGPFRIKRVRDTSVGGGQTLFLENPDGSTIPPMNSIWMKRE